MLLLLALAGAATLTIWNPDPFMDWIYEGGVFLLACWVALRSNVRFGLSLTMWVALAVWGFVQLGAGWTVYRTATLNGSLRVAAFSATALVASAVFGRPQVRDRMLRGFAWFGLLLGIASVVAYYASPGRILWMFPSPYPDVWGPFLSRNNFAQFMELAFPVALWLACSGRQSEDRLTYMWMSAVMLACGLASSSRAGAVLLVLETLAVFLLVRPRPSRRLVAGFAAGAIVFAALAGGDTLIQRFHDSDPLQYRREIFASSVAMIANRPWTGYGLGTFATVYPEFATFDAGAVVEHAHNDWLEWASEGGWPYAAVWLLLALAAVRPALRSIWGIGVVAVFLHALVDYPFARFGVAAWLFILVGALENSSARTAP
jgi:O-antigen ligase